ncbi:MAG: hypothetical protein ACOX4H_10900 [Bacillota bacterium]|nr:hypothetical protein [Clostridia bacterium]
MCQRLGAHTKRDRTKFPPELQGEQGHIILLVAEAGISSAVIKEEGIGLLPVPKRGHKYA